MLAAGSVGAAAVAGFCFAPVEVLLEFSPFVAGDRLVFFGWALRASQGRTTSSSKITKLSGGRCCVGEAGRLREPLTAQPGWSVLRLCGKAVLVVLCYAFGNDGLGVVARWIQVR